MNKFITKLAKLFLGISMAAGVGVAVGAGRNTALITNATDTTVTFSAEDFANTSSWTYSGSTSGFDNSKGVTIYKADTGGVLTSPSFTKVTAISCVYSSSSKVNASVSTKVGSGTAQSSGSFSKSQTNITKSLFTSANGESGAVQITITCTASTLYIKSITVTTAASSTWSVTYDLNGGTGTVPTDSNTYSSSSSTVTVADSNGITKQYYNFAGWTLNAAGTGTVYGPGTGQTHTYSIDDDTTFYAKWTPKVLDSLRVVVETPTTTKYSLGQNFDPSGLVIYATIDGVEVEINIASTMIWNSDNALELSQTSVTGTYTLGEVTKSVTIEGISVSLPSSYTFDATIDKGSNSSGSGTITRAQIYSFYCSSSNLSDGVAYRLYSGSTTTISTTQGKIGKITFTMADGYASSLLSIKSGSTGTYSNGVWTGEATSVSFSASAQARCTKIKIELKSEASLSSIALSGTYPTEFTVGDEFSHEGMTVTATLSDESEVDVTSDATFSGYDMDTAGNQTVTVTYTKNSVQKTTTYNILVKDISISSNTIKENDIAVQSTVSKDGCYDDDTFTFTATIVYTTGASYGEGSGKVTWASSNTNVATISSEGVVSPVSNGSTTISATPQDGSNAAEKVASFTLVISNIKERVYDSIVDEIILSDTGISGSTYASWSGVSKPSGAVYAGFTNENASNPGGGIGMRASTSPSGLWVTTSPGVATKVEVTWKTTASRTLYVFGKDTAYAEAAYYSDMLGEEIGSAAYSSTTINLSKEYKFIALCVTGGAAGFEKIKITWKVPGAEFPLTDYPELSTGSTATAYVGKNLVLDVTTTPSNSDEKLIATSSNENYVTVSGSGKNFLIYGVAIGTATVTIAGAKGQYSSTVTVTVEEAVKTYEDKIITPSAIGITGKSYADNNGNHDYDGVTFYTNQVQLSSGALSFQQGSGYIQNSDALYEVNDTPSEIKAITLFMHANNQGTVTVYEGTSAGPSTTVSASCTTGDVVTYTFSSGMTYFKIKETGSSNVLQIDRFIIELADDTSSVLNEARSAANIIINGLKNTCGGGNSGVVTQSQWDGINSSISALNSGNGLSADAKLFLKDATRITLENLSQGGITIENAMAHYDYCVTKFHFTPYSGITHAQPSPRVSPLSIINTNTNTIAIIVIISMVSVGAIGGYFFIRKRKENI